ncbi:hypothetical protein CEUSTIGMA_g1314.t1 [Chlamydomonas eustigma]|uniref:Plastid lipid-associated protein/fibrillin conserved domain-containing protein n=1 Tax=Chlamydomonas eustigma TaxID=1157962 RepID=A0A250WSQ7_9CHLO|nr:hypothetical protein CEUSTIGMA_g1314.t1 [Chlamydomonas eustigma]|eukprot:GAX73864.1 hypothetical protein CEUSTIGMA_g1314.t1 [Chlamydomonas eustigma]
MSGGWRQEGMWDRRITKTSTFVRNIIKRNTYQRLKRKVNVSVGQLHNSTSELQGLLQDLNSLRNMVRYNITSTAGTDNSPDNALSMETMLFPTTIERSSLERTSESRLADVMKQLQNSAQDQSSELKISSFITTQQPLPLSSSSPAVEAVPFGSSAELIKSSSVLATTRSSPGHSNAMLEAVNVYPGNSTSLDAAESVDRFLDSQLYNRALLTSTDVPSIASTTVVSWATHDSTLSNTPSTDSSFSYASSVIDAEVPAVSTTDFSSLPPPGDVSPSEMYRNPLVEGLQGALQWLHDGMKSVVTGSTVLIPGEPSEEPRISASNLLRDLVQQIREESTLWGGVQDSETRAVFSSVMSQISYIAERMDAGSQQPMYEERLATPQLLGKEGNIERGDIQAVISNSQDLHHSAHYYNAEAGHIAGIKELLSGIKGLGDSILEGMDAGWSLVPPSARVAAYIIAAAGVLFLLKMGGGASKDEAQDIKLQGSQPLLGQTLGSSDVRKIEATQTFIIRGSSDGLTAEAAAAVVKGWPRGVELPSAQQLSLGGNSVQEAWQVFRESIQTTSGGSAVIPGVTGRMLQQQQQTMAIDSSSSSMAMAAAVTGAAAVAAAVSTEDARRAEVERAAGSRMLERELVRQRQELKDHVRWATLSLGPVTAVVPGGEPVREEVDKLLQQLEGISPTDKPLNVKVDVERLTSVNPLQPPAPQPDPSLLGSWKLVYASTGSGPASDGTSVQRTDGTSSKLLAQILQLAASVPGVGMDAVTQNLGTDPLRPGLITMENYSVFSFGPLGQWRVGVSGKWVDNGGGMCAEAIFQTFSTKLISFLGLPTESAPEIVVAVPEALRNQGTWCTTYLDSDTRISRQANGSLFLFKKQSSHQQASKEDWRRESHDPGHFKGATYSTASRVSATSQVAGVPSEAPSPGHHLNWLPPRANEVSPASDKASSISRFMPYFGDQDARSIGQKGSYLVDMLPLRVTGEPSEIDVKTSFGQSQANTLSPVFKKHYDGLQQKRHVQGFVQQGASA